MIGKITSKVKAVQVFVWSVVHVELALVDQPVLPPVPWDVTTAVIVMIPISIMTIMPTRIETMPNPFPATAMFVFFLAYVGISLSLKA